jgi:hypothetical protein
MGTAAARIRSTITTQTTSCSSTDLGAHVEFHLGEGENEQVHHFDTPRCIVIPRGMRHFPMKVTEFRRPFVIVDLLTAPTRRAAGTATDFTYVSNDSVDTSLDRM